MPLLNTADMIYRGSSGGRQGLSRHVLVWPPVRSGGLCRLGNGDGPVPDHRHRLRHARERCRRRDDEFVRRGWRAYYVWNGAAGTANGTELGQCLHDADGGVFRQGRGRHLLCRARSCRERRRCGPRLGPPAARCQSVQGDLRQSRRLSAAGQCRPAYDGTVSRPALPTCYIAGFTHYDGIIFSAGRGPAECNLQFIAVGTHQRMDTV